MKFRDITGVTGVLELTWCYNHNSTPLLDLTGLDLGFERSWQGHVTWVYKCIAFEQKTLIDPLTITTTTALEQQIAALLHQLKETKEAERLEAVQKEAEATAEKAHEEEEQRRLRAEAEAEAEHVRRDAEERRTEQELQEREREEVEVRRRRSCLESTLTPVAALETELPKSKRARGRGQSWPQSRRGTGVVEM